MPQNNPCVTNGLLPPDIYDTNLNTQLTYNIDFDFVAEEDVVVFREQPAGTFTLLTNSAATGANPPNYTINQGVSPAQVTFAAGEAPGGVSLIVGRRTDICDPVVEYQVGAAIRAGDLNASNTQLLHLIQELRSSLGFIINGNSTDPIVPGTGIELNDLDDVNVGDPVNPDPALLRFNGTEWVGNTVLEDGDAWVSNDTTFATTAAGDTRWLQTGPGTNILGGDGIAIDTSVAGQITVDVDLAATTPGLQFDANDDLQVIGNSVTENAGDVRLTNGPSNVVVNAGANVTVTRDSATQFTIAATNQGAEVAADVAELNTLADGPPDDGRVVLLQDSTGITAAGGPGANINNEAINGLPETVAAGGPIGGYSDQISVTLSWDNGNTRWQFIRWEVVNSDARYINAGTEANPINDTKFGTLTMGDGSGIAFESNDALPADRDTVTLNADDATETYNITLPPTIPGAGTRYLRAAGTDTGANQELEWATGGGGATGGSTATQQDYIFQENGQAVRNDYTVGTTLAAQPGSGVTTGTCNALSAGPVTINNGVTVTIENGSNWVVI